MLVLAQVHVDARDERTAEGIVEELERNLVRIRFRRDELTGEHVRLLGARAIEDVDVVIVLGSNRGDAYRRRVARLPHCECRLELCLELGHGDIAHRNDRRVVRLEPGLMEPNEVGPRDAAHRCFRPTSGKWLTVRMVGTIEQQRQHAQS